MTSFNTYYYDFPRGAWGQASQEEEYKLLYCTPHPRTYALALAER